MGRLLGTEDGGVKWLPEVKATPVTAIEGYVGEHNLDPKPFIWTAKAGDILAKITRARTAQANNAPSV